jgi:hypothetical protein
LLIASRVAVADQAGDVAMATKMQSGGDGSSGVSIVSREACETPTPDLVDNGVMNGEQSLRDHLLQLLDGGNAHLRFDDAVKDFPSALRGKRPSGGPHSAWELLEHLRLAQSDILEFTRDPKHVSPPFPDGYWPSAAAPPTPSSWDESIAAFRADLRGLAELASDESIDLYAPIAHGQGQTVLREILLAADHNSYHLGQLVTVRRLLGA